MILIHGFCLYFSFFSFFFLLDLDMGLWVLGDYLINGFFVFVVFLLYEISSNFGNGYLDSSSEMGFNF